MRVILFLLMFSLASDLAGQVPDSLRPTPTSAGVDSVALPNGDSVGTTPLMIHAGRFPSPASDVRVISDSAIIFSDFRSPADLLRSSAGIFVVEAGEGGFDRLQSVHGLRPGAITFSADGMLLDDPSTGLFAPWIYPLGAAERVEIAGPATGPLYGLSGVGGAVNYVSRSLRAPRPVSVIRSTQSAYGYSTIDAAITQDVSRGLNVSLGITRPAYDGRYLNSGLDAWKARANVRYDLGGASVHVSEMFTRWTRGLNGGISPLTPDSLIYDRIRAIVNNESATGMLVRHDLAAGIAVGSAADSASLTTFDIQLAAKTRRYIDEAGGTGSTGTPFRDTRREQSTAVRLTHSRVLLGQRIFGGAELRNRRLLEDPNVGSQRTLQAAAFGRLELKLLPALTITPGVRLDRTMELTRISAGVEAAYRPAAPVLLRGSVSRAHRFPSFIEAYGIALVALPLTDIDAERHDLVSGGFTVGDSSGTFFSADVFHRSVTDAVILDSSGGTGLPPLAFLRVPKESRDGVSATLRLVAGSIYAEVNADYLLYHGDVTHRYAPEWSFGGGVFFRDRIIGDHLDLKLGFRGRYFTSYDGGELSRRYETYIPSATGVPPAGTLDFVLVAGLGDAYIHFIWENLLDREYFMEVLHPANDRSVRFGVSWSFLD